MSSEPPLLMIGRRRKSIFLMEIARPGKKPECEKK
jgi:hypothetical protein